MSSFDYFATSDESVSIIRALTMEGFKIVVEPGPTDTPKAITFEVVDSTLVSILEQAPVFYLSGPFTRFGVAFSQHKTGTAKGKYYVDNLTQGPLLTGLTSRINLVKGARRLLPGRFSYEDAYKNPETNEWEKATPEVKAAFRQVVSVVKDHCPRFTYKPGIEIYIGPEALALLQADAVHIVENQIVAGGVA